MENKGKVRGKQSGTRNRAKAKTGTYKRLSEREKKQRAQARAELRKQGILPPVKPKLNRERFCKEAGEILANSRGFELEAYIIWALFEMVAHRGKAFKLDLEAVGAAKVIKLAARRMEFEKELRAQGKTEITVGEIYEAVKEIYEA